MSGMHGGGDDDNGVGSGDDCEGLFSVCLP